MSSATSEFVNPDFLKSHQIVRAGAGAGKTYALTHRVSDVALDFKREHGQFPRVIVTTFTRKATGELRERLMLLALDEAPELIDFVNSRSQLVVSTIHGVMDLYLKRYGANICVDPSYTIIGDSEANKLARQTMREIALGDAEFTTLLESLAFNRMVSLARKVDALFNENPQATPFKIADFEELFRERAAEVSANLNEASARIREETDKPAWIEVADVYIGFSALLTRGNWSVNRPLYISARETLALPRKNAKQPSPVSEETIEFVKTVRDEVDEFLETIFDPQAWEIFTAQYELFEKLAKRFHETFHKTKMDQGWLEISDLEHLAMKCIREFPQTADAFCREWDYWLIDEYQDTSPFQVELLKHLTGEKPNFVVGDPQQSIYLFRGARSEVFGAREKEIIDGGGEQKLLTMNRRSRPELLLFLNDFFTRLDPPFQPMEPFFKEGVALDPARQVATVYLGEEGEDESEAKNAAELRAIVHHVQKLLLDGAKPEDICILARTNATLQEVAGELSRASLPTHLHAASGFYDRRETRDALALLKFLANPHDNFNTVEVLRSPWFKMVDRDLALIAKKRPESLWNALLLDIAENTVDAESVTRLKGLLDEARVKGLTEVFKSALISGGFIDLSHFHDVSGRRESNIWKLLSRLQLEEGQPGFNPLAFVASCRNDIRMEESNSEGDAVAAVEPNRINLMTIHSSKGLEFDHVILPRMEQKPRVTYFEDFTFDERRGRWAMRVPYGDDRQMTGSLPEARWLKIFRKQELEEHARVLYVALTRAVETVFLSWTGKINKDSWADMVKLDLELGPHQTESYSYTVESGEPAKVEAAAVSAVEVTPRAPFSASQQTAESSLSVTELLDRKAGSKFVAGNDKQVTGLLQLAAAGTAVHKLMELLKYPSQERLERLVSKWFPGGEGRIFKAIDFVRQSTAPPLLEIIANGEVEWGFAFTENGTLIEGQIDLWGRTDSGEVWIVDYKTGNPEFKSKAFEQMGLYTLALHKSGLLREGEKIKLAAVYPFARQVFVEDEPGVEKAREMLSAPRV